MHSENDQLPERICHSVQCQEVDGQRDACKAIKISAEDEHKWEYAMHALAQHTQVFDENATIADEIQEVIFQQLAQSVASQFCMCAGAAMDGRQNCQASEERARRSDCIP